jgi:predicted RNA-binding protein associated with RNAse of E/G family
MIHPVVVAEHHLVEKRHVFRGAQGRASWPADTYQVHEHGLYWALPLPDGPEAKVKYIRAHLLPKLGIQVCRFEWWRGHPYGGYDYYLDIIEAEVSGDVWTVRDYYLDLLVWEGERAVIHDSDEYLAALEAALLSRHEAAHALTVAHATLNGLGECGYSLSAYLASRGIVLSWI